VNDELAHDEPAALAGSSAAPAADSPLARVRRRYAQRREELHLDLPIPGATWNGELVARVRIVDEHTARAVVEHEARDGLDETADVVAAAVGELLTRAEDGSLEPLLGDDGAPLRFDARFGAALGEPGYETARAAVFLAFTEGAPPAVNVLALGSFVERINRWLSDTSAEIEGAIVEGR
jgi:hypothetical protein